MGEHLCKRMRQSICALRCKGGAKRHMVIADVLRGNDRKLRSTAIAKLIHEICAPAPSAPLARGGSPIDRSDVERLWVFGASLCMRVVAKHKK
jgi:hypothetical protein